MEEQSEYKEFVESLVLNNKINYSDIPYGLRSQNIGLFHYAIRAARDGSPNATQYVSVLKIFLADIDEIEKQGEVNIRLRRRAIDAILGVENIFTGVVEFDEFIRQQKEIRQWLFKN